jgi:Holliday junction resolvasome RuvABC DNA-binding subunit
LDSHKTTFSCIFDHGDAAKLEKIVEDINTEKEKSVKLVNDIAKRLPEELKKRGVDDISKEDIDKYGMAIAGLIAKGYKKDKLKKAIDQIKNQTNESLTEA